jgi:hypothetical protein
MGRYGAKQTAEATKSLDINWLGRKGYLVPGLSYSLSWTQGGEPVGSIGIRSEPSSIVLDYRWRQFGREWEDVTERIYLTSTPCNYGGYRRWFVCPHCSRRVGKLYLTTKYFWCRRCSNLAYASQRCDRMDRLTRKIQNIRTGLGGSWCLSDPFPPKPKGMHETTYRRLEHEAEEAERRRDDLWIGRTDRFLARHPQLLKGLK